MRAAVGDIVELVCPDGVFGFFGQPAGCVDEMPRVCIRCSGHKHELSTQCAQRVLFLLALRFGHDDDRLIPQRIAHQSKANAGITCRALNNRPAGLQQALPFGIADDVKRGAILYRRTGVHIFAFAKNIASGCLAWPFQADERGVANQIKC